MTRKSLRKVFQLEMLFDTYDIPSHLRLQDSFSRRHIVGIDRYMSHRHIDLLGKTVEKKLKEFYALIRDKSENHVAHCWCCRPCAISFISVIGTISVSIANSFLLDTTVAAEEFVRFALICFYDKNL